MKLAPHDIDAEESMLGAMLLSPAATEAAIEAGVWADDFYKPAHGHVFDAVVELHRRGVPVDAITVADVLRRHGLLDAIGGPALLVTLQAGTPATTSTAAYAAIVRDRSDRRRALAIIADLQEAIPTAPELADIVSVAGSRLEVLAAAGRRSLPFSDLDAIVDRNVTPEVPTLLVRGDGAALLYGGRMHTLQGEPASGKTWVALIAACQVLAAGGNVLLLDYEDTPAAAVARLLALGVDVDTIRSGRLRHLRPDDTISNADIVAAARTLNVDLVVIDSVAEALHVVGASEDKADEYLAWLGTLPRRLAGAGCTVLLLDHVTKSKEERGRWARGSGAKLGAVDGVTYTVTTTEPFNQRTPGRIRLVVAKDRPGGLDVPAGKTAASIHLDPTRSTGLHWTIDPPLPEPDENPANKEAARHGAEDELAGRLAERIDAELNDAGAPLSRAKLADRLRARRAGHDRLRFGDRLFRQVLEELATEGRIIEAAGPQGHAVYTPPPRQETLPVEGPGEAR